VSFGALRLGATVTKYVGRVGLSGLTEASEIYRMEGSILGEQDRMARLLSRSGIQN